MKKGSFLVVGVVASMLSSCVTGKIVNSASTSPITTATPQPQNSISYALPKTELHIVVEIEKTTTKAGPFHNYAYRYLNIKNVTTVDDTTYTLKSIQVIPKGVHDPSKQFAIVAKGEASAQYISLSDDGVLLGINNNAHQNRAIEQNNATKLSEIALTFDSIPFLERHLKTTSEAMMAEAIANHIYKLRKRQLKLAGYEYDHHPNDAANLKLTLEKLNNEEIKFTQLFTGKSTSTTEISTYIITPDKRDVEQTTLFRISEERGLIEANEEVGKTVNFSYKLVNDVRREQQFSSHTSAGLYYCKPAEIELQLFFDTTSFLTKRFKIAQLGGLGSLPYELLADPNTTIELEPATGALLKIGKTSK